MNAPKYTMWHRRQREGGRGRSLSKDHYSPHRMPSADLAASQLSTLFLPFNPLPWQVRESHAVGPTRRHSIWSVTPIKQSRTVAFQELLKQPMATLMDGYTIRLNSCSVRASQGGSDLS